MESSKEILKKKGINPSYQRIKIFEYLQNNKNHPTVEMIYKDLASKIPTLSKTTIYNTLKLFAEKGIVSLLIIDQTEIRVDPNVAFHTHLFCMNCNKIHDVMLSNTPFESIKRESEEKGYKIREIQITLRGTCKDCLEKNILKSD
ncbi:MAG: transcriptional repressor [Synergistetes bacterium]|nr:transcriptional repressor [Synergistota bacterium]MCX8128436.1 transcriptional repressor [Synergistota bacterium]MDW8193143.1 Fur family transcriptional regulator [Synergistota bacterium]